MSASDSPELEDPSSRPQEASLVQEEAPPGVLPQLLAVRATARFSHALKNRKADILNQHAPLFTVIDLVDLMFDPPNYPAATDIILGCLLVACECLTLSEVDRPSAKPPLVPPLVPNRCLVTIHATACFTRDCLLPNAPVSLKLSIGSLLVFTGNPLDRSSNVIRKFDIMSGEEEVSLLVVAGREVASRPTDNPAEPSVLQDLQALLMASSDPEIDLQSENICLQWKDPEKSSSTIQEPYLLPLYLLGRDSQERWTFALDVSEVKDAFLSFLQGKCQLDVTMSDLRHLMPVLSRDACAMAGHAVALSQWHSTHKFCPRCGCNTTPTDTGLRRRCLSETPHKQYPRTDPVSSMYPLLQSSILYASSQSPVLNP
eukprot:gene22078-29142_t